MLITEEWRVLKWIFVSKIADVEIIRGLKLWKFGIKFSGNIRFNPITPYTKVVIPVYSKFITNECYHTNNVFDFQ